MRQRLLFIPLALIAACGGPADGPKSSDVTLKIPAVMEGDEPPEDDELPDPQPAAADGMAFVAAGAFVRGSSPEQVEEAIKLCNRFESCTRSWFTNEQPQRTLTLSAFHIDLYEVTNAQYDKCVRAGACPKRELGQCQSYDTGWSTADPERLASFDRPRQPATCVTWHEATAYCTWKGKRLPTEAEWEKAARGTDGRLYPWGDDEPTCTRAMMDPGTGVDGCGKRAPAEVGSFTSGKSAYGAYDMAGNVAEWVFDVEDFDYYEKAPEKDPVSRSGNGDRVMRGGHWSSTATYLRTANRGGFDSTMRNIYVGFRCAKDVH